MQELRILASANFTCWQMIKLEKNQLSNLPVGVPLSHGFGGEGDAMLIKTSSKLHPLRSAKHFLLAALYLIEKWRESGPIESPIWILRCSRGLLKRDDVQVDTNYVCKSTR